MERLVLRTATTDEAEQIASHVNACYRGDSSRKGWTTEADLLEGNRTDSEEITELVEKEDSVILLCLRDQELIASVHLHHQGDISELNMLAINPTMQGRGIGKWVMAEIEQFVVRTWRTHKIKMSVITLREELIAFYERRGYRRTGERKRFDLDERNGVPQMDLEFETLEKELV